MFIFNIYIIYEITFVKGLIIPEFNGIAYNMVGQEQEKKGRTTDSSSYPIEIKKLVVLSPS